MTTSHRPQLEARSGAKAASYVPTSTQHARLLPGHKKLKYRKSKDEQEVVKDGQAWRKEKKQIMDEDEEDESEEDEGEEEEEVEEEEEEENQEALLQELNNIRQERMIEKIRNEQKERSEMELTRTPATTSGWRKTTFGRNRVSKRKPDNKAPEYVNDMTKTAYHEGFIRRFIK